MGRRRNRRGSTLVEFAILGIPLIIMVFGMMELLVMGAVSMMLANATEEVARELYTGQFQKRTENSEKDLKAYFCDQMALIRRCDDDLNLLIDVRDFGGWDDVSLPPLINPDGTYTVEPEPSDKGSVDIAGERIVVVRVLYRWQLRTPGLVWFMRTRWLGNTFLFQARVFVTEPWDFLGTG